MLDVTTCGITQLIQQLELTVAAFRPTSNNRMSSPVNKEHLPFIDAEQGGQRLSDISGLLSA